MMLSGAVGIIYAHKQAAKAREAERRIEAAKAKRNPKPETKIDRSSPVVRRMK